MEGGVVKIELSVSLGFWLFLLEVDLRETSRPDCFFGSRTDGAAWLSGLGPGRIQHPTTTMSSLRKLLSVFTVDLEMCGDRCQVHKPFTEVIISTTVD